MEIKIADEGLQFGTWNHRLVKRTDGSGETYITIEEVHYDQDGQAHGWTSGGHAVMGETVEELAETLRRMARALSTPMLVEQKVNDVMTTLVDELTGEPATGSTVESLDPEERRELEAWIREIEEAVCENLPKKN